jgi:hypothetical protein
MRRGGSVRVGRVSVKLISAFAHFYLSQSQPFDGAKKCMKPRRAILRSLSDCESDPAQENSR